MFKDQADSLLMAGTMTSLTPQAMDQALDEAGDINDLAALTAACINKAGYVEDSLSDFEEPCPEYERCLALSRTWYELGQKAARALCGRTGQVNVFHALEACGYCQERGWWIKEETLPG